MNEPPAAPYSVLAFPERDFVSTAGYADGTEVLTIDLLRNGTVINTVGPTNPIIDPKAGPVFEVNHPGTGLCWTGNVPYLRPGDQVRQTVTNATGTLVNQTTIQDMTVERPINPAPGVIEVHGTAIAIDGNPLPLDQIEQRIVARNSAFVVNGRRTLRAGAGLDGTLTYDPVDPTKNPIGIRWTATYKNLASADVTQALASEVRIMWLGHFPAALSEQTIVENNPGVVFHGPSIPPCAAGVVQEPLDSTAPTIPAGVTASANGRTVSLTWSASTDDVAVRYYNIYRDTNASSGKPQLIKTVGANVLSFTDNNVPSGDHTYSVDAVDAVKNASGPSAGSTVTIGAVVPTIDNKPPSPSKINQGLIFAFSSTTPGATFLCSFSNGADQYNPCTSPISYGTAAAPLLDGAYTFKVIAQDTSVPPIVSPPTSYNLLIDTVAPTVTIDSKPTNPTNNRSPSFAFSSSEPTATLRCTLGPLTGPPPLAVCTSPFTPSSPLADGSYTFQLQATDAAGNVGPAASYNFNVSTAAPTVTLGTKPPALGNNASPSFSFSSTATGATFECSLVNSGTALPAFSACSSPFNATALADASYDFNVRVTDNAGNTGTLASPYTFAIDTKAPTVAASPLGGTFNTAQTITLTANDVSPTSIFYTLDGTTPTAASTKYAAAFPLTATTTVKFIAIDGAGNSSAVGSQTYTIDGVAPTVSITPLAKNPTNATSGTIGFASSKTGSTFTCTFGPTAGPTTTGACTSPFSYGPLTTNGNYTLSVTAKDTAGNTGTSSYAFVLDTVAPTITASPLGGSFTAAQTVTLTSEAGAQIRYTLGPAGSAAPTASTGTVYTGPISVSATATLQYIAIDTAGNASAVGSQTYTISTPASATTTAISAPAVSWPANGSITVTVSSTAGTPAGNVSLTVDGGAPQTAALTAGKATFTLTNPAVGNHSLSASYAAQGSFAASSGTGTLTVNRAATTTTISAPAVTSPANGVVTVTVGSTAGTPAGNLSLSVDGAAATTAALNASGQATFTLTSPAVGTHTLSASYAAQGNFAASTGTGSLTVNSAATAPTVTIASKPASVTNSAAPSFAFTSSAAGATFQCSLSTGADAYSACTSPKSYAGLASGLYTFKVIATSGTLSSTPATYTFRIDTVAPTATVPTKTLVAPNTLTTNTAPVRLAWSGSDTGAGISRYEMQLSFNAGAFAAVTLSSPTATSATVFMSPGNNQVRVRAVDAAGNVGAWATTAVFNVGTPQETSTSIAYTGTWTASALTGAFGGSVKSATASGATAKLTFTGSSVALVTTKGPNRGIAQIFIDGSTTPAATVDLYAASQSVRQLVYAKTGLSTTTSHTITVKVTGTKNAASTSTRIDVDAFVVLR